MGIWDDIKSVGSTIGDTALEGMEWTSEKTSGSVKALGGAALAGPGLVWDLAKMPFDDKNDDFGSFLGKFADRGGDALQPVLGEETLLGSVGREAMHAANWAYEEAVDQPIATLNLMQANMAHVAEHRGIKASLKSLTNPEEWARAYKQAEDMSLGEAAVVSQYNLGMYIADQFRDDPYATIDPLNDRNPYSIMHDRFAAMQEQGGGAERYAKFMGAYTSQAKWTADIAAMMGGDPAYGAAKGLGALRNVRSLHALSDAERANAARLMVSGEDTRSRAQKLLGKETIKSRTEKFFDYIDGANPTKRALTGAELRHVPEIRQYSSAPTEVAGLLGQAAKIENKAERHNAYRTILAVAAGDESAIRHVASMRVERADELVDQIESISKGYTIPVEKIATNPQLKYHPAFIQELQAKATRLDSEKALTKFVDEWNARIDFMIDGERGGIAGSMKNLPGVHAKGNRAIKRENQLGNFGGRVRRADDAIDAKVDQWSLNAMRRRETATNVFQKGLHTVPMMVVKPVRFAAGAYTKPFTRGIDALRNQHYTGVAKIHDWGQATGQLDALMKRGGVAAGERMQILSRAMVAKTEPEKASAALAAENAFMRGIVGRYSEKFGEEVDKNFVEELMLNYAGAKSLGTSSARGRAYAATQSEGTVLEHQMALRGKAIERAEEAAAEGGSRAKVSMEQEPGANWRVDQFVDEYGMPVSMPLLETQGQNTIAMIDADLADKLLRRNFSHMARMSRSWRRQSDQLAKLEKASADARAAGKIHRADQLDRAIQFRRDGVDWLMSQAQNLNRLWKFSVLFRLGYPLRVLTDDHLRITARVGALNYYPRVFEESKSNVAYNTFGGRKRAAKAHVADLQAQRAMARDKLGSDEMAAYPERLAQAQRAGRSAAGIRGYITRLENEGAPAEKIEAQRRRLAEAEAEREFLFNKLGDESPEELQEQIDLLNEQIGLGWRGHLPKKRKIGDREVVVDGEKFAPAMTDEYRTLSSSSDTYDAQLNRIGKEDVQDKAARAEGELYRNGGTGDFKTYLPTEPGHLAVWADILKYQIGQSKVARFFLKGGTAEDFPRWLAQAEQAALRQRLPHYAADPEDWGNRVEQMILDYVPTEELREAALKGEVTRKMLAKHFQDPSSRPAVHGELAAHNLGIDRSNNMLGRGITKAYRALGEMPTDRLSRHPFFAVMYESHVADHLAVLKAGRAARGEAMKFTAKDKAHIEKMARRDALADVRRTLFDISSHSHAAHVMRFLSPFFAAHQEALQRWWHLAAENPGLIRRFQQAFDLPRHAGLVIDENGDPVKPGDSISSDHQLMLPEWMQDHIPGAANWSINENSFNILMPGGLTNPGAGPVVSVPFETLAQEYADEPSIQRISDMFNPYPQESPLASAMPATLRRAAALAYSANPDGAVGTTINALTLGVGKGEFNTNMARAITDLTVDFQREHGREPTAAERSRLIEDAKHEALVTAGLRFMWNSTQPFPPRPNSKYAAIQQGWWSISSMAKAQGYDFDWARARFKEKYGEAYLPLAYSASKNPAYVDGSAVEVEAVKRYDSILSKIDPSLSRMVRGPFEDMFIAKLSEEEREEWTERTMTAQRYFQNKSIDGVGGEEYLDKRNPVEAMEMAQARRGWMKLDELDSALMVEAQQQGLGSYLESKELIEFRRAMVGKIMEENDAFARDYQNRDTGRYDAMLKDMEQIVSSPLLKDDLERTDVQVLKSYLELRQVFDFVFEQRKANGLGGPTAQANEQVRLIYTQLVGRLVESNTYFSQYAYAGTIEHDPYLLTNEE